MSHPLLGGAARDPSFSGSFSVSLPSCPLFMLDSSMGLPVLALGVGSSSLSPFPTGPRVAIPVLFYDARVVVSLRDMVSLSMFYTLNFFTTASLSDAVSRHNCLAVVSFHYCSFVDCCCCAPACVSTGFLYSSFSSLLDLFFQNRISEASCPHSPTAVLPPLGLPSPRGRVKNATRVATT